MKRFRCIVTLFAVSIILVLGIFVVTKGEESILRWVMDWPLSPDPAVGQGKFVSSQAEVNLYSSLVYPTPEGGIKPHVAERWEVSEDGLTYTFFIRPGILFSNGYELKAEDVAFSFKRLLAIGEKFAFLFEGKVTDVKALDQNTVEFTLEAPYGPFLAALTAVYLVSKDEVMAHIETPGSYGEFGDYGMKYLQAHSAGSGAYMIKEFEPRDYLLMEKNPHHSFESSPNLPDLVQIGSNIDPVAVQSRMKNRDLEISDRWQPEESLQVMTGFEGVEIGGWDSMSTLDLMFHTRKPPTDDIHVRKALSWVFDYDAALSVFPGYSQARGPVPYTVPGWNPNVFQYHQDLGKAREEIAKSKYAGELNKYPIEVSIWTGSVPLEKVALILQANAAEIGLKVEISSQPQGTWFDNQSRMETTKHITFCWNSTPFPDAGARLLKYHSSTTGTHDQCEWLLDPEMDRLIEDAMATPGEEERFAKYYEIQDRVVELAPTIWAHVQFQKYAYQASYVNWLQLENPLPISPSNFDARFIEVFPEKR